MMLRRSFLFSLVNESVSTCWTSEIVICCDDVDQATLTVVACENENVTCGVLVIEIFALISIVNDDVNGETETLTAFLILTVSDVSSGIDATVTCANEIAIDSFGLGLIRLKSEAVLH